MAKRDFVPDEKPLELVKACGPTEAEMIQEMLKNNGIESDLQGDFAAITIPAKSDLDEVRIWVCSEDADRARDLIDAFFTPVAGVELEEGESDLGVDNPEEPGGFTG
jgi:hypothetical protein